MNGEDFDLDRSIVDAWEGFTGRLAEVLSVMDDQAQLKLGTPSADGERSPFIQFRAVPGVSTTRGEPVISAEAVISNSDSQFELKRLAKMGWKIEGSGVIHKDAPQADSLELAKLAVKTLRQTFGVHHPVFLSPDHLAEILQPTVEETTVRNQLLTESLNLQPDDTVAVMPTSSDHLIQMVADELEQMYGHPPVADRDGDLAVRVGSSVVFLRATPDLAEVVLFAPLVHDIEGRTRAAEVINDLNVDGRFVKFFVNRDRVFIQISVLTQPFVPAHLHQAMRIISEFADNLDDELALKLHGRTTFSE